jgi:hypothetical protein
MKVRWMLLAAVLEKLLAVLPKVLAQSQEALQVFLMRSKKDIKQVKILLAEHKTKSI